jgi:PGF-CTERM protein
MAYKELFSALLTAAVVLSMLSASGVAFAQAPVKSATPTAQAPVQPTTPPQTSLTIARLTANNPAISTFAGFLLKANLTNTLNRSGNFTVFAPTNAAFAKMPPATLAALQNNSTALKRVLQYHIVKSRVHAVNFTGKGNLNTLAGVKLNYSVNAVTGIHVDNATVTQTNINATNGVIHLIDSVMIPPAKAATAKATTTTATASSQGGFLGLPGFEAVYAVAGLVAVAYLALRRTK